MVKFGFVGFLNVDNPTLLGERLKGVGFEGLSPRVSIAKFERS